MSGNLTSVKGKEGHARQVVPVYNREGQFGAKCVVLPRRLYVLQQHSRQTVRHRDLPKEYSDHNSWYKLVMYKTLTSISGIFAGKSDPLAKCEMVLWVQRFQRGDVACEGEGDQWSRPSGS
jgi:hypothetical protein